LAVRSSRKSGDPLALRRWVDPTAQSKTLENVREIFGDHKVVEGKARGLPGFEGSVVAADALRAGPASRHLEQMEISGTWLI
jgi:hypothetical protein